VECSVPIWAAFLHNWAVFFIALREIFSLLRVVVFWASFIKVYVIFWAVFAKYFFYHSI